MHFKIISGSENEYERGCYDNLDNPHIVLSLFHISSAKGYIRSKNTRPLTAVSRLTHQKIFVSKQEIVFTWMSFVFLPDILRFTEES